MAPPRAPETQAHLDLALAYVEMGLLDDAIEELEKVLQVEPWNRQALEALQRARALRA